MAIVVRCPVCTREFEPKAAARRAGTWQAACHLCHLPGTPQPAATPVRLLRPLVPDQRRITGIDGLEGA